jgi:hypothetical protein
MKNLKLTATLSFLLLGLAANAQAVDRYDYEKNILSIPSVQLYRREGDSRILGDVYTDVELKLNNFEVLKGKQSDFPPVRAVLYLGVPDNTSPCLAIVNDGTNDQLFFKKCAISTADATLHYWNITQTEDGTYLLQNEFTGTSKCLDIVNDGTNNKLIMQNCVNSSGQAWSLTKTEYGNFRLRNEFSGKNKCLDFVIKGANKTPIMANCANVDRQAWSIF